MICGQCHVRGSGNGTIDGEGKGGYASRNNPTTGEIEFVRAGIAAAEFFGQPDGTGILPDFGTSGGYFNPFNFATSTTSSWQDRSGGFGSEFDHAKQHRPQYPDHLRAAHAQNPYDVLACWNCHDPHGRQRQSQLLAPAENNVLCLRCHAGFGDFGGISQDDVDVIAGGGRQPSSITQALQTHAKERTFELVGVAMNINLDSYLNPGGANSIGRCVTCHMAKTAKSASYIVDAQGFVIEGDIHAHTFDVISPQTSEAMAQAGQEPIPNSCVPCHRGLAFPDYRYRKQ
jgi:predicted CXXCH cytochrome family protein